MNNKIIQTIDDISEYRLKICYKCPLYSSKYGGICNNNLLLNPETGDVSSKEKFGYIRGCGCLLEPKVKNANSSCPVNKW